EKAAQWLTEHPAFERIVGHTTSTFSPWSSLKAVAPGLHGHIKDLVDDVLAKNPSLKKPFKTGIYPVCTFNVGPRVVTYIHKDNMNLPYGWCAVTALGDYDPEQGGHLYLQDLNVLLEFPPGCTVFLPSAVMAHGNTPVQLHET
ncbi:hypothetical protein OF83DRAFT_1218980, partial [Amylostereum chailletii]